jgi:predicted O-methyltransferase YrrM
MKTNEILAICCLTLLIIALIASVFKKFPTVVKNGSFFIAIVLLAVSQVLSDEGYISQFGSSDLSDDQLQPLGERHLSSMQYLYDKALNITGDVTKIEGNLYTSMRNNGQEGATKLRRMVKIAKNPRITSYLEVGVNAGHSLMNVLLAGKEINKVLLFDLAAHSYMKPNLKYIRNQFPHVDITLVEGDSTKTIPRTPVRHKFDMIHIDGGHSRKIAYSDIINCRSFAHADSILIIDDCMFNEQESKEGPVSRWTLGQETCLEGAVKQCIDEGIIEIYCCDGSKGSHVIGRYIGTT